MAGGRAHAALLLLVSPAGRAPLLLPPSLPQCAGLFLYNSEGGQKEGKGLSGPQGQPGQEKVRKVTAEWWRWTSLWVFTAAGLPAVGEVLAPCLPGG